MSAPLLAGCDTEAQFAPSLTRVVGLQVEGETLQVLTGAPCGAVTRIVMLFTDGPESANARTILEAPGPTAVERIGIGVSAEVAGFETVEALPAGFDWRDHAELDIGFDGPDGDVGGATSVLGPVEKTGAERAGDGTAYVRGVGWLTPDRFADRNTKDFLAACTSDPERP